MSSSPHDVESALTNANDSEQPSSAANALKTLSSNEKGTRAADQTLTDSHNIDSAPETKPNKYELTDQTNFLPHKQVIGVFIGLATALCCAFMEQTIIATALPQISSNLRSGKESTWVATSYLLTSLAFTPLYGRWSDIFGRKTVLLSSLVIFWIFSLACAVAQNIIQLIVFRAMQGIGGGALITLVLIIISDVVSLRDRGKYQSINEIVIAFSTSVGPILGGVFTQYTTWRWCFWINLPLAGLAMIMSVLLIPFKPIPGGIKDKMVKVDYTGSILTVVSSALLLLGLSWGGVTYSWESVAVLIPLIFGFLFLCLFLLWEWRYAKLPIVPVQIFKNPTVVGAFIATVMSGMAYFAVLYYMPQFLQVVRNSTPLQASVSMLPFLLALPLVVFIHGQLVTFTGRYKLSITTGYAMWTIAQGLQSTIDQETSSAKILGFLFLAAVGAGGTFQTTLVASQAAVARSEMAVVTGVRNFLRLFGNTVVLAIAAAITNNSLSGHLSSSGFPSSLISEILDDPTSINDSRLNLTMEEKSTVVEAYTKGFQGVFYMTVVCTGIAFLASVWLIQEHELDRADDKQIKSDVKRRLQEEKEARKEKRRKKKAAERS